MCRHSELSRLSRVKVFAIGVLLCLVPLAATIVRAAPPTSLNALAFGDARHGFAAGDGVILATTDGGATWERRYSGPERFIALDMLGEVAGWAVATDALFGTADDGQTWTRLGEPAPPLVSVAFTSPTAGFGIVGTPPLGSSTGQPYPINGGQLVRTSDGGRSWTPVALDIAPQSVCASGYVAGGRQVLRTSDGGATWATVFTAPVRDSPRWDATIACASPEVVWVLMVGTGVALSHQEHAAFMTANGGADWRPAFEERYTVPITPPVDTPNAPGTYPGPFAVADSTTAYFIGLTPPVDRDYNAAIDRATVSGLTRLGTIPGGLPLGGPYGLAFAGREYGWLATGAAGQILATTDGGVTWTVQYPARQTPTGMPGAGAGGMAGGSLPWSAFALLALAVGATLLMVRLMFRR
ncbi:MAG: WD40/YVTN/BNR-like repeat-containing protein [Thermomicrobiales bacterium]